MSASSTAGADPIGLVLAVTLSSSMHWSIFSSYANRLRLPRL